MINLKDKIAKEKAKGLRLKAKLQRDYVNIVSRVIEAHFLIPFSI